jgi:hypothetical protein
LPGTAAQVTLSLLETPVTSSEFWEAYSAFVLAFREAADKLKAGDRTARFPLGSFPPGLPFVTAYPSRPP